MTVTIRCPDCEFVAQGRTNEEALQDFTNNATHTCEPQEIGSDPNIGELQLRCMDHAQKARKDGKVAFNTCTHACTDEGWVLVQKAGVTYAEPCPIHKPDFVHPDHRKPRVDEKERIREHKKQEAGAWL